MSSEPAHRILTTGSRGWSDADLIRGTLVGLINGRGWRNEPVVIVHGDCKDGADALVHAVFTNLKNPLITLEPHPASDFENGRNASIAPLIRNGAMVKLGAEVTVAFLLQCMKANCHKKPKGHGTHGTEDTLEKARKAHIETLVVRGGVWY